MSKSVLDDFFNKKLGNYNPDVPAHIWENIMAKKEKRRPVAFWLNPKYRKGLFLLLGVLILGTSVILLQHNDSTKLLSGTKPANAFIKNTNNNNSVNDENSKDQDTKLTAEQPVKQQSATDLVMNATNNKPEKDINTTEGKYNKPQNINNTSSHIFSSNNNEEQTGKFKKNRQEKSKSLISLKNATPVSEDENNEAVIPVSETADNIDVILNQVLLNPDLLLHDRFNLATVKKPTFNYVNIPCPESEKNTAGNKRYFEIYAGPDYAFRNITDTANSAYLQKRKESSRFTSAFSTGIRYTKVFNNGMSFRTGINYSQINEKFKYAEGNIIQVVYITNSNGDTTGSFTTSGTRYKTTFNKFRTLDIPLMIGYEMGNSRLHVNFNAGAIVNLYSWQKGDVLDTAYKPVNITTGNNTSPYQFKTNMGIGFIGAISVYYKLTTRLHLLAEPYFRYNFSPASKADLTLKQKYTTTGLRLGLRLDF